MPASYAHACFGQNVLQVLPDEMRTALQPYQSFYEYGQYGPDFFFFYKPLFNNPINEQGKILHAQSGKQFFAAAKEAYAKVPTEKKEASRAYLTGFLCHFILDSVNHAFIVPYTASHDVTHVELEGEYERYLLQRNGKNPKKENLSLYHIVFPELPSIAAPFTQGKTEQEVRQAMDGMRFYKKLVYSPSGIKRRLLVGLMGPLGLRRKFQGQFVNVVPYPYTEESNRELDRRTREICLPLAKALLPAFWSYLEGIDTSFQDHPQLRYSFDGEISEKS